jgi:hypothetical protein
MSFVKEFRHIRDPRRPLSHRVAALLVAPGLVTLLAVPDRHPPTAAVAVL